MVGWVFGDFLASLFIHKKLREVSEKEKAYSFAEALSRWHGNNFQKLRLIAGLITIVFLGTYASAQLNAGSKALHVLFGWEYSVGAIIGAIIVVLYCFSGGIRASIWTDAAQSFVMFFSMGLMVFVAINEIGGREKVIESLSSISPSYLDILPSNSVFGVFYGSILFIGSWVFAGFGVVGQPHIMVRFMAMDQPRNMKKVRFYYYCWYVVFCVLTVTAGLLARVLLPEINSFDAELALPILSKQILPEVFVGLILAGLFAATISTADSQILSCSSAITKDIIQNKNISYMITKLSTVFVTIIALIISLTANKSVFSLVIVSWSALACAFAPLITVFSLGGKPSEKLTLLMVIFGLLTMILWRYFGFNSEVYEAAPGILVGFGTYWTLRKLV